MQRNVVQAIFDGVADITIEDFNRAFSGFDDRSTTWPRAVSLEIKENYTYNEHSAMQCSKWTTKKHYLLEFRTETDAAMILGMRQASVFIKKDSSRILVNFAVPATTSQDAINTVGRGVQRLFEISGLWTQMPVLLPEKRFGQPVPRHDICDEAAYYDALNRMKDAHAQGQSVSDSDAAILSMMPVKMNKLVNDIKALYDEQCAIIIEIRELQLQGKINFHVDLPIAGHYTMPKWSWLARQA